MGRLGDLFAKRTNNTTTQVDTTPTPTPYNRFWLSKVSNATGFIPSQDNQKVDGVLGALNRKDGHCPCGGTGDQFLCPCHIMRTYGMCKCGLFENVRQVQPQGNSSGRINK